jgi:hypothetical protein
MAILGAILKRALKLQKTVAKVTPKDSPIKKQEKTLRKLLLKAQYTEFGRHYGFSEILRSDNIMLSFQEKVPTFDYNKIYELWWKHSLEGKADVCWPGVIKFYALSSGTSESASKRIPITEDILRSNRKTGIRQILALNNLDLPDDLFEKKILMLGGSTDLMDRGHYFEGDLSGISQAHLPLWITRFYKPGKKIARERDWNVKIDEIVKAAPTWDIGYIAGVPAWIQLTIERIIAYYGVKNIHDIWPNFSVYAHGGVAFEPYKKSFERLLGKPIHYMETYLASEGFIAYQSRSGTNSMELVLNNGIFIEFVPFNDKNFDAEGNIVDNPQTLLLNEVKENVDYAILLSTNAGTWRYLIGDTIKFTNVENSEIIITGRTKHFLSLCGEHLSVENMNSAIKNVSQELNLPIKEFTVLGVPYGTLFAHHWFIGTDEEVDAYQIKTMIDAKLKEINDDYEVERRHALKDIFVSVLPSSVFLGWMERQGKIGAQNKFPRVLKKEKAEDWMKYLREGSFLN